MLRTYTWAILAATVMTQSLFAADVADRFAARTYKGAAGELKYRLFTPADYDAQKKYPLVLFFHGAGERGDDNTKQLVHGMQDFSSAAVQQKYPCFIVAPQCPNDEQWVNVPWSAAEHTMPQKPAKSLQLSLDLLKSLQDEFSIDPKRMYVTGLSMGGYATWDIIQREPELFAAAAPICGGGDKAGAKVMARLPLWAFHGGSDSAVNPQRSRDMIAAIKAAGGAPKYTEYEKVGHDSWSATYRDPEFYAWLFAQQRD